MRLVWLRDKIDLAAFAARCVDGDLELLRDSVAKEDAVFVDAMAVHDRLQITSTTYVYDAQRADCVVVPPLVLFKCSVHTEPMQQAVAVRGLISCKICGDITGAAFGSTEYERPTDYRMGCNEYCLSCWLGNEREPPHIRKMHICNIDGNLIEDFAETLSLGYHLAVMPISRLLVEGRPICLPDQICILPQGFANFEDVAVVPNSEHSGSLAERVSYLSGVTFETLEAHTLIVLPCRFDWEHFRKSSFRVHHELIRSLSEMIDSKCLDLIKFRHCEIEPIHSLPARAGQITSNPMMAGAMLINGETLEGRLIGGDVFTHIVTRGVGLAISHVDPASFPVTGDVGNIVRRGLSLFAALLESNSQTAKYVQCISLMEYLAYPFEFAAFEKVRKIVSKYMTDDKKEYEVLKQRFMQLTGRRDEHGEEIGYRTRIVHFGSRLEDLIPSIDERLELFNELERYIRAMLNHMIEHADLTWTAYLERRNKLGAFPT